MHANKRTANVDSGVGLDMLDGDGMLEGAVAGGGERAACLGLRYHVHDFGVGYSCALDDDGAVQVLAALRRDVDAERFENGLQTFENRLADFGHGMAPDVVAERGARAASDDHDIACGQVRFFDKFLGGVHRVVANLFDNRLVVYFVCNTSHLDIPFF